MTRHTPTVALVALILGALGIATAPIFARYAEVGPVASAFWRLLISLPVVMALGGRLTLQPGRRRDIVPLLLAGLYFGIDLLLYHIALNLTSVANATLLSNAAPIFVAIGAWLMWRQTLTPTFLIGLVVALVGAVLLSIENLQAGGGRLTGDLMCLGSAVFYGAYILTIGRVRANYDTWTVLTWSALGSVLFLLPMSLLLGERVMPVTWQEWIPLLALGLFTQVLGQGLIAYALAHLPPHFSSVALMVQPAAAAVLAWMLFNESLGMWQAIGGVVILTGIFFARKGSRTPAAAAE